MDEKTSNKLAHELLAAISSEDVAAILKHEDYAYYFDAPEYWSNYGNREKNWDAAGNQQSHGVGALVENIVNGIDAVLLRKAEEAGVTDPRASTAPQSMQEAVKRYFNVPEGKLSNLDRSGIREIAKKTVKVCVDRARKNTVYPTYTIIDEGIGQRPEDFPKTFLSLSEKNKEGIKFVQGKFNQGSTGVLRYCTRGEITLGHYKLIISRKYNAEYWGWTLVRVREPKGDEAMPVVEYFKPGKISSFRQKEVNPYPMVDELKISSGSIVKLYEVDISTPFHNVDFGIYQALSTSLVAPPLPIRTYDFGAAPDEKKGGLRKHGIADRICSGLFEMLKLKPEAQSVNDVDDEKLDVQVGAPEGFNHHVQTISDEKLGVIKINVTVVPKLQEFILKQPKRAFYTINGQTHGSERASWINVSCKLGDIKDNIIVNVDCTDLTNSAISQIFMTDRERVAEGSLSTKLREITREALQNDERLKAYMHELRIWRATQQINDNQEAKDILESMVKGDPTLRELFGLGKDIQVPTEMPKGNNKYQGVQFPTFLKPLNVKEDGDTIFIDLPKKGYRKVICGTDAANDYLSRNVSPGEVFINFKTKAISVKASLKDGAATFTFTSPENAKVGSTYEGEFGFDDVSRPSPLTFRLKINIVKEEEKVNNPPGKPSKSKEKNEAVTKMPNFHWVKKENWSDYVFDENSGAAVTTSDEGISVHVNYNNKGVDAMRYKEKDEAKRMLKENIFKYGIGIISIAIFKKHSEINADAAEDNVKITTEAIAPIFIGLVKTLSNMDI
jgi:hypothetical protein